MSKLTELAERCEQATGPDRSLDLAIAEELRAPFQYTGEPPRNIKCAAYTASLDAAMTLVPEGCHWWMPFPNEARIANDETVLTPLPQRCATPALALCAAALRARTRNTPDSQKDG